MNHKLTSTPHGASVRNKAGHRAWTYLPASSPSGLRFRMAWTSSRIRHPGPNATHQRVNTTAVTQRNASESQHYSSHPTQRIRESTLQQSPNAMHQRVNTTAVTSIRQRLIYTPAQIIVHFTITNYILQLLITGSFFRWFTRITRTHMS